MDAATYDAKIFQASALLKGMPAEAAKAVAKAVQKTARAKAAARKVSGEASPSKWYELQARFDAAKKVLSDAIASWKTAATDAAKDTVRNALGKLKDAVQGAKDAASIAKSAAASTWQDIVDQIDKTIGTIGGAAVGGAIGGLLVMAALAWVLLKGASRA